VKTVTSPGGRLGKEIPDGFGRTRFSMVRETTGTSEVWLTTQTVYEACSCSTSGKATQVSRPYRSDSSGAAISGETIYWTTTESDGLGRPKRVILPDGKQSAYTYGVASDTFNSVTTYGSTSTSTEPGTSTTPGKAKRMFNDGFGRLMRVDELNSSSTLVETARYTYDELNHMTKVQMGWDSGTSTFKQTRTFNYNDKGQLTSSVTPEKGTVTYHYNSDGLLDWKQDAKSQRLNYTYDSNHRLTLIRLGASSPYTNLTSFTYDGDGSYYPTYALGRMTSATNTSSGYTWHFSYDVMGRVNLQTLQTPLTDYTNGYWSPMAVTPSASYSYDSDGKMTGMVYPGSIGSSGWVAGTSYQNTFDNVGRITGLNQWNGSSWQTVTNNVTYNSAGQMTAWQEGSTYLRRAYDPARGWVQDIQVGTSSTDSSLMNFHYDYFDNGQAQYFKDKTANPSNPAVYTYGYDNLNRLTSAATSNAAGSAARRAPSTPTSMSVGGEVWVKHS